jgi:signal transduction histidine kinase
MHNLRYKLLIQFIIVAAVLLLAYSSIWITITKNQIINTSTTQVKVTAQQADMLIQNFFDQKLAIFTTYRNFATFSESDLQPLLALDSDISEISIVDSTGQESADLTRDPADQEPTKNVAQTPEFKVASFMSGQTYISPVFQSRGTDAVTIAVPLKSHSILVATVDIIPLEKQLRELKINESGTVSLIQDNKTIHPDSTDVYQAANANGQNALQYRLTNKLTGWGILAQDPLSDVLKPLDPVVTYAVWLFVAGIILTVLLSLTLGNGVVTAFRGLKDGFENFNKGNLAFRIPVSGNGEIEALSLSLNRMIGDIHQAYLTVDKEKKVVLAEKAQEEKTFAEEKEHMKKVLSEDEEKVNYGLFVEKEKVNAIMANITDAVILLNKKREIMFLNKVAEDLLGYKSQEMQNKLVTAAMKVYEKDTEVTWDEYAPMTDMHEVSGNVVKKEKVRLENSTISPRFVTLLTVKTNFNQTGDLGFIIIMHNLDQEIQLEKTEMHFVDAVIRELKAPLAIMLQCFPLLRQTAASDEQKMYMTGLQTGVDQLSLLMQNFILATMLEDQKIAPDIKPIDIIGVINHTREIIIPQAQGRLVAITFAEPTEQISQVAADAGNVRDILLNLLGNAIKFTPQQGTVGITVRQLNDEVLIEIQDSGPGVPKEEIPNLFKKFYTVQNTQDADAIGTGLGLYIAKSLAELNHGKIWADSVEGKGSTFGFSLPKAA